MRLCKNVGIPPHHVRVFCPRAWSRCWCGNLCNSDLVVGLFLVALLISSFLGPLSHLQDPCGSLCMALQRQTARMGNRLPTRQRGVRAGRLPAVYTLPPGGNPRRDAEKTRCAATARMPLHLTTQAALAAARAEAGTSAGACGPAMRPRWLLREPTCRLL